MSTTAPVSEDDTYFGELVFPHLAVGDGFVTELILFSNAPGQAASGELRTWNRDGNTFPVMTRRIIEAPR